VDRAACPLGRGREAIARGVNHLQFRLYANVSGSPDPETKALFSRNPPDTWQAHLTGIERQAEDSFQPPQRSKGDNNVDARKPWPLWRGHP